MHEETTESHPSQDEARPVDRREDAVWWATRVGLALTLRRRASRYSAYDFVTSTPDTYNALYHHCSHKNKDANWSTSTTRNTTYSTGMDIGPISLSAQSGYSST